MRGAVRRNRDVPLPDEPATFVPNVHSALLTRGFAPAGDAVGDRPTASTQLFTPFETDPIFVDDFDAAHEDSRRG